ncbi:hypothetical protein DFH06DRAFT_1418476 [Mycena polygramma]|nr:hypothetical protein DFH06DRAFT_1418476 [Mycena polygramma]
MPSCCAHHASHAPAPCHLDSGAATTFIDNSRRVDDNGSDYPDSLPDLVTDSGTPYPRSDAGSALIGRGPLDVVFPGTCDINLAPNVVDRLLGGNCTVRTLYQGTLGAAAIQPPPPSVDDLVPVLDYGQERFRIREAHTFKSRRILDTVSAVIHCAANDHNPWLQGSGAHIPSCIPDRCLEELSLPMPAISLLRNERMGVTFEMRMYDSVEEALAALQLVYDICHHFILWMAYAMLVSFENGSNSAFNFGAVIGMTPQDFLPRVRTHFPYGGFAPLAAYMADKQRVHDMDFALVRLLNPECEQVLIGSHNEQSYITTWPVPSIQLPLLEAAPVPASARDVLSRGIRRRQLKSVQELLAELML